MKRLIGSLVFVFSLSAVALGQGQPTIAVTSDVEDGKKMIHAVVLLNNKPLENVTLQYFVQRTFGNLLLGEDTTLDDGSSAVPFPSDLPGSADGKLSALVRIKTPEKYANISASAALDADIKAPAASNEFPRALWAPQAPLALMASIFVIVAAVWGSYLFVAFQVLGIRKAGRL
jgi:hypothetical protein